MFIQEFKKEFLSLDNIQFAVGLALDALGEMTSAQAVIALYRPDMLGQYAEKQYKTREQLNRMLITKNHGLVYDFIEFLYTEDYLLKLGGRSRVYKNYSFTSLADLSKNRVSILSLYKETMRIVLNNDPKIFIYLYTHTNIFKAEFRKYMYREGFVGSFKTGKRFSKDVINAVLADFAEYINMNSCTGAYHPSTCTPNHFLFGAMKWYTQEASFYDILNARSQFGEISSGNNLNLLSYVQNDVEEISIDFMALASKITLSSYSLFNHTGDKGIAYYDIFSWYRDNLAHKLFENNKQLIEHWFPGVSVKQEIKMEEVTSTKRAKAGKRVELCAVYNSRIMKGISITDIYDLYTTVARTNSDQCTHVTDTGSVSDGIPYYSYGNSSPRTTDNNSDKFKKDYEGFLALKELVNFLNSPSNNTGITVFNMPVDIFRDKRLLRRYNSFSEYIMLDSDVKQLMSAVDSDATRSEAINARRIRNNDSVFTTLVSAVVRENERNKQLMGKLLNTKFSDGEQIVASSVNQKSLANRLGDDTSRILHKWNDLRCIPGDAFSLSQLRVTVSERNNLMDKVKLLFSYFVAVYKELRSEEISKENKYSLCMCGMNTLIVFLEVIGKPIVDADGYYNLLDLDLEDCLVQMHTPDTMIQVIKFIVEKTITVFDLTRQNNWEDYRILFTSSFIMQDFLAKIKDLFEKIKRATESDEVQKSGNNLYLLYADLIANYDIMQIKWDIDQIRDLSIFYTQNNGLLPLDVSNKAIAYTLVERRRNKSVVHILQNFLDLYGNDERDYLDNLNTNIYATLTVTETFKNESKEILQKLGIVNASILLQNEPTRFKQDLESKFQFDENNFVIDGKTLVSARNALFIKYFHRYGYTARIELGGPQLNVNICVMTQDEKDQLEACVGSK